MKGPVSVFDVFHSGIVSREINVYTEEVLFKVLVLIRALSELRTIKTSESKVTGTKSAY